MREWFLGVVLGILIIPACGAVFPVEAAYVSAPPLRTAGDTRSAFEWVTEADFPQAVSLRWRVEEQHRARPNPWEVGWLVLGCEERFVAWVPKEGGWHLEVFEAGEDPEQRFLVSGEWPKYPVGEPVAATMIAWEGGVWVVDTGLLVDWRWGRDESPPSWWGEAMRGGMYVEDCSVVVGGVWGLSVISDCTSDNISSLRVVQQVQLRARGARGETRRQAEGDSYPEAGQVTLSGVRPLAGQDDLRQVEVDL